MKKADLEKRIEALEKENKELKNAEKVLTNMVMIYTTQLNSDRDFAIKMLRPLGRLFSMGGAYEDENEAELIHFLDLGMQELMELFEQLPEFLEDHLEQQGNVIH